ncbi:MAG TPA: MBL fold metallo-hydrolase [Prolixibacteraceae bacterium]|nr:MBL fold metallo-hydrolase [Prolixibacteraceae bacterium]
MIVRLLSQKKRGNIFILLVSLIIQAFVASGQDTLAIHMLGHASLYFAYGDQVIHVDPNSNQANYSALPDADLLYITHGHGDHYDTGAINKIKKDSTLMVCTQAVKNLGSYSGPTLVLNNGDSAVVEGIPTKAVASYNLTASNHPRGVGNGYVLTFGEKRIYIAGDTENIPEMKDLGKIDIAFLPMNLPYTMSVPMAAEAAKVIRPDILYIYHFGNSDTAQLRNLLIHEKMEIRMGKSTYYESTQSGARVSMDEWSKPGPLFGIYPNPSNGWISICNFLPESTLHIFDPKGKLVLKKEKMIAGEAILDLSGIKGGVFCARMINGPWVMNRTFIIQ